MKCPSSCLFNSPLDSSKCASAGYALARIFVGLTMAFAHGLGKLPPPEQLTQGLDSMGFPMPGFFSWCVAFAEFGGGLMIALGLLTRPGAALLGLTMAVAAFIAHSADPFNVKEMAFLYLAFSVIFFSLGGGKFSIDHFIGKKCIK